MMMMIWQVNQTAFVCNLLKLALFSKALQDNVCITQRSSASFFFFTLFSHSCVVIKMLAWKMTSLPQIRPFHV